MTFEFALLDTPERTGDPEHPIHEIVRFLSPDSPGHGDIAPHELLGQGIARLLMRDLISRSNRKSLGSLSQQVLYVQSVCQIALLILTTNEPTRQSTLENGENAFAWLHSLISGELDADRGDYLLRDGRNYGFEFAAYNLGRLLDNVMVALDTDNNRYVTAIRPQGLSTVESFLLSRFRSYQLGVRHHKVVQLGAALRFTISHILAHYRDVPEVSVEISEFFEALSIVVKIAANEEIDALTDDEQRALDHLARFDDLWWMSISRRFLESADRKRSLPADKVVTQARVSEWLALVCWRARGPRSLWKRTSDFRSLLEQAQLQGDSPNPVVEWNNSLGEPDSPVSRTRLNSIRRDLEEEGVLVLRHKFVPWKEYGGTSEHLFVVRDDDILQAVSEQSAITRALRQAWREDVQIHAFATSESPMTGLDVLKRLSTAFAEEETT